MFGEEGWRVVLLSGGEPVNTRHCGILCFSNWQVLNVSLGWVSPCRWAFVTSPFSLASQHHKRPDCAPCDEA